MAINFPGPYELRIFYTSADISPGGPLQHEMRLNINLTTTPAPGSEFDTLNVEDRLNIEPALDEVVEDWLTVIAEAFNTTVTFDVVELWEYPTAQSFESNFISAYAPTANSGNTASAAVAAAQSILTFRTQEGGIMKVSLMEPSFPQGVRVPYANMTPTVKAIADFVLSGDGVYGAPFLARDTSYPFASIAYFPGQNEALFKQRFR